MFLQPTRPGKCRRQLRHLVDDPNVAGRWVTNPVNVTQLNTTEIEVPNWVSADGCILFFTRNVASGGTDYDPSVATRGN